MDGLIVLQVPPSLWERRGGYGKVVCTGGLSKSFGLSGLRCGWLVAPPELLQVRESWPDTLVLQQAV